MVTILYIILHCHNAPNNLKADEILVLKEAVMVLQIFERATEHLSADPIITLVISLDLVLSMNLKLNYLESKLLKLIRI